MSFFEILFAFLFVYTISTYFSKEKFETKRKENPNLHLTKEK